MNIAIFAVAVVTLGTVAIGAWGVRFSRTTSDLYVASRAISPWTNAAAVSGEYLSAASFLGIAGLEMQIGVPALWQAVGFAARISRAASVRRRTAPPIRLVHAARFRGRPPGQCEPEAACRGRRPGHRRLLPRPSAQGRGHRVRRGKRPRRIRAGIVVVGIVVTLYVALGGMRGVSYVQAFQFWVKTVCMAFPAIVLLIYLGGIPNHDTVFGDALPHAPRTGTVVHLQQREVVHARPQPQSRSASARCTHGQGSGSRSHRAGYRSLPEQSHRFLQPTSVRSQ